MRYLTYYIMVAAGSFCLWELKTSSLMSVWASASNLALPALTFSDDTHPGLEHWLQSPSFAFPVVPPYISNRSLVSLPNRLETWAVFFNVPVPGMLERGLPDFAGICDLFEMKFSSTTRTLNSKQEIKAETLFWQSPITKTVIAPPYDPWIAWNIKHSNKMKIFNKLKHERATNSSISLMTITRINSVTQKSFYRSVLKTVILADVMEKSNANTHTRRCACVWISLPELPHSMNTLHFI